MQFKVCFSLAAPKGEIFAELKQRQVCIFLDSELPKRLGDPGPLDHLNSLATIVNLAASLPERLKLRDELGSLAKRAMDVAVADFGPDVNLHQVGVKAEAAPAL